MFFGISPQYSGLVYFSSFFFYLIARRYHPLLIGLAGLIMGSIYGYFAYTWLGIFSDPGPFYLAVGFNTCMILLTLSVGAYTQRRFAGSMFAQIFSFGFVIYVLRTIFHFSPYLPQAKAFLTIVNGPTLFDWLVPYLGSSVTDILCLATGVTLALLILNRKNKIALRSAALYGALLMVLMIVNVAIYSAGYATRGREMVKVALLQGDRNESWEDRINKSDEIIRYYLHETIRAAKQGAKIVVWPEYAVPRDIVNADRQTSQKIADVANAYHATIVLGSLEFIDPRQPTDYKNKYDLSLVFDPIYARLQPYRAIYPIFENVVPGKIPIIFESQGVSFPVVSCFEVAHHRFISDYSRVGNFDMYIAIANIQAFHDSAGLYRISSHVRRLALENGKYFVYVSNTGPSFVLDPLGNAILWIDDGVRATKVVDIPKIRETTIYARFQEIPLFLAWVISIWIVVASHRKRA